MNYPKYVLVFLITFFVAGVSAQNINATTDDGQQVILHANGAWSYASDSSAVGYSDPDSNTVYVTRTGEKYHRGDCQHLKKSKIPTTLTIATTNYSACKVCKPPGGGK